MTTWQTSSADDHAIESKAPKELNGAKGEIVSPIPRMFCNLPKNRNELTACNCVSVGGESVGNNQSFLFERK